MVPTVEWEDQQMGGRDMRRHRTIAVALVGAALVWGPLGCASDDADTGDAGGSAADTGAQDGATGDTGGGDTGGGDAGAGDTGGGDTGGGDAAGGDAGSTDTGPADTGGGDTAIPDAAGDVAEDAAADVGGDTGDDTVTPICTPGEAACQDGDVHTCTGDGAAFGLTEECDFGCDAGACVAGPAAIAIGAIGTDVVALGQSIALTATVVDEDGQETTAFPVTWTSSMPNLLGVAADGPTGAVVTGLAIGGGDKTTPDGSLTVTASIGPVEATLVLQVIQLDQGTGLQLVPLELTADPNSDGRAHYDGVYTTPLSPAVSSCNPYAGGNTCTWHIADGRLFVGASMHIDALGAGKWDSFGKGLLQYPPLLNADGVAVSPAAPRPLFVEWTTSNPAVATVHGGYVTATGIGQATISATVGPQTWTLDLVVYNQFGYDPTAGYAQGVTPEDGHLMLFSSSAGMAIEGTHDTVRYVDLADYRNLDFRPSKYGPQGVRLVEQLGGVNERYPGFGCGMVKGAGDVVWLFNGWTAIPFDTAKAKQVGNLHKVAWRPDGAADGANQVCSGAFVQMGGRDYLIGFDAQPWEYSVFVADVTDLDGGNVEAVGVADPLFVQVPQVEFYNPTVFDDGATTWLLFMEQTPKNAPASPNKLRFAALTKVGDDLVVTPDDGMTIETAPTPNAADNQGEAPALTVAEVGGAPMVFVGSMDTVTVIDPATWTIVDFSGTGSEDPLERDLDTRRFGANIKAFATSPDGQTLYALPETSYPIAPYFNTKVEWENQNGATQSTNMTVHRLALIDLTGLGGASPRLMVDEGDPSECFLVGGCGHEQRQYGYDLNLLALKQWMLATGFAPSTGAIIPPQAMNVRQLAVGESAVFLIGRDNADGVGTALGNMSDVAIIDRATGRMPVFRGWRGDPAKLVGLSDPFGFRIGEDDAVLGDRRVKNAGVLWLPGAPPAEKAGDGTVHGPDVELPDNGAYANAPAPATETGRLVLLSSSHQAAKDGTHDAIRTLDLSAAGWPEQDADGAKKGAQGQGLTYVVKGQTIPWSGGCGLVQGQGSEVWLFNGDSAVVFDTATMAQGKGGHQVTFDDDPANPTARVCTGALVQAEGKTWLVGVNVDLKPTPKLFLADVTDLGSASVDATPVQSAFFDPDPDADPYDVRYVAAVAHGDEVWFLEKNDPWNNLRNTVHRAQVSGGALVFDMTRESDISAGWTTSGDPGMALVQVGGKPHLFVGNQGSVSVFDVSNPDLPGRYNYNEDGDGVQDDLDTSWYGRGIQAFAASPDGGRLYALPWEKSAALPKAFFTIPLLGGGTRTEYADRYRLAVIDLKAPGGPDIDGTVNNGNGIDLNYWWFKQWLLKGGTTPLPPMFPYFRRQLAASSKSVFLIGFDNDDGAGSALANAADVATYDLATGKGHLWRGYEYEGLSNAGGLWGYDLGVDPATGEDDEQLKGGRAKNAGVVFVP